ncbi:tRNA (guanine(10)-N2)-methyltransferase homolog isoform X2 [Hydra vulgaris]|uniref:tRNA (guanine(10)-N(2))-methyltransferase n=2 Tax=Hydra vulgaris TaxID=6087 RepID=A0ABM4CF51_HYDVU
MKFICYYAQEFEDFRLTELQSICNIFNIPVIMYLDQYDISRPYLIISVDSVTMVQQILSRSVLLKSISEYWAEGVSLEDVGANFKQFCDFKKNTSDKESFKFQIESTNKKLSMEEKVHYMESLQRYVEFSGEVDLKSPTAVYLLMLHFNAEKIPSHIYFGKLVGVSQRNQIHVFNLKTRYFIGNTSMDPQLAFIMANIAEVQNKSFCYDPFVGTGSIILACSHFGGISGGSDIDFNVVFGRGKSSRAGSNLKAQDEIVRTNFEHYKIERKYWDILACDATHMPIRANELFDVIVTDPPYGIREGGRKLGSKKDSTWEIPENLREEHIPAKKFHALSSIIMDLFEFSFKYLVVGGRLVYWLPVFRPSYSGEIIPKYPGFKLTANCEQVLTTNISRRLITMAKTTKFEFREGENGSLSSVNHQSMDWVKQQDNFRNNYFKKQDVS